MSGENILSMAHWKNLKTDFVINLSVIMLFVIYKIVFLNYICFKLI